MPQNNSSDLDLILFKAHVGYIYGLTFPIPKKLIKLVRENRSGEKGAAKFIMPISAVKCLRAGCGSGERERQREREREYT